MAQAISSRHLVEFIIHENLYLGPLQNLIFDWILESVIHVTFKSPVTV